MWEGKAGGHGGGAFPIILMAVAAEWLACVNEGPALKKGNSMYLLKTTDRQSEVGHTHTAVCTDPLVTGLTHGTGCAGCFTQVCKLTRTWAH